MANKKTLTIEHNGQTYTRTTARNYLFVVIREAPESAASLWNNLDDSVRDRCYPARKVVSWHMSKSAAAKVSLLKDAKMNAAGKRIYRGTGSRRRCLTVDVGTKVTIAL